MGILHEQLEHGRYVITGPGDGLYLPPGCLHAVYTLNGGLLGGINWMSASSLEASSVSIDVDLRTRCADGLPDFIPFLWSLVLALETYENHASAIADVLPLMCRWKSDCLLDDIGRGDNSDLDLIARLKQCKNPRFRLDPCRDCHMSVGRHIQLLLNVFYI